MGKKSKVRGTGYEYRIVSYFRNEKKSSNKPLGWEAERNSLSREEKSFGKTTAKHDVKAWKDVSETERIFLQIEAKKTGKDIHTIQKTWIDKISFSINELLVIALNRTGHYAVVDIWVMPDLYQIDDHASNQVIQPSTAFLNELREKASKIVKCRGSESVRVHKEDVELSTLEAPLILNWENIAREFCVFPLYDFVKLREKIEPNIVIGVEDQELDVINLEGEAVDIPSVKADVQQEIIITCPRTGLPIRITPIQE